MVDILAIGPARVDVGDDRVGTSARGVEIGVHDATITGELHFMPGAFGQIETRLAELADQGGGGAAHDALTAIIPTTIAPRQNNAAVQIGWRQLPGGQRRTRAAAGSSCAPASGQCQREGCNGGKSDQRGQRAGSGVSG